MKERTYRICILSMVVIALVAGIYFYVHMGEKAEDTRGALLVMEEQNG